MTTLQRYFMEIVAVCIPAIIVFLCFRPYRMKALAAMKLKSTRQHEIALILFIIAIFGILALTLWPPYIWEDSPGMWGHLRILIERPNWKSNLSLVPFTVFKDYLEDLFKGPVFFIVTLINFFGNLAIFMRNSLDGTLTKILPPPYPVHGRRRSSRILCMAKGSGIPIPGARLPPTCQNYALNI